MSRNGSTEEPTTTDDLTSGNRSDYMVTTDPSETDDTVDLLAEPAPGLVERAERVVVDVLELSEGVGVMMHNHAREGSAVPDSWSGLTTELRGLLQEVNTLQQRMRHHVASVQSDLPRDVETMTAPGARSSGSLTTPSAQGTPTRSREAGGIRATDNIPPPTLFDTIVSELSRARNIPIMDVPIFDISDYAALYVEDARALQSATAGGGHTDRLSIAHGDFMIIAEFDNDVLAGAGPMEHDLDEPTAAEIIEDEEEAEDEAEMRGYGYDAPVRQNTESACEFWDAVAAQYEYLVEWIEEEQRWGSGLDLWEVDFQQA